MRYAAAVGRVLYSAVFILAGPHYFRAATIGYAASRGVPLAPFSVPVAGAFALAGGLSVALGWKAKSGAWLIVLFLALETSVTHRFWELGDPVAAAMQQIEFMKNLSMIGGALLITQLGSGPASISE